MEQCGVKIVLKNNDPVCVLVQPKRYEKMVGALKDYALFFEKEKRRGQPHGCPRRFDRRALFRLTKYFGEAFDVNALSYKRLIQP